MNKTDAVSEPRGDINYKDMRQALCWGGGIGTRHSRGPIE